ncbi:B12-binding domain-containing radical SAM protein [Geomonas sp. Red32]|uniref:B12-binding domain-containing radical SAM protein n=1 Tax=Geomonas sp. Red32 TaxID=2912856 RepID=UPI00202CDC1A|nr:radical SAM protein [Geomonas sp. Red32]MCM0083084.1 B12-binding domain-containing radical SAM protein [Geomonas sp. Red32]
MKLLLISPGWPKGRLWGELGFKFPSLSLAAIAAATPEGWDIFLGDENLAPLDFSADADLVGITAMTPQAPRAYEIAAAFRSRGIPVVMGGFHASNLPEEALEHVDAVVVGEGEPVWPLLVADLEEGKLKRSYRGASRAGLSGLPRARREIFTGDRYLLTNTIQTTRGCPHDCEFCSVTTFFGRRYRERPIPEVLGELAEMRKDGSFVFFVDDNLVGNRSYALELFRGMRGMGFKWLSHAPIDLGADAELLQSAGEAGCVGMFVGFESLSQKTLAAIGKRTNQAARYLEQARAFRDHGIGILGSFVLGCDGDTPAVFEQISGFCESARLEAAIFPILTPYPGTRVRQRLEADGRIVSNEWRDYDMGHVTYRPVGMSGRELQEGHDRLNRSFYSFPSMFRRIFRWHRSLQVFAPMNLGFRAALGRVEGGAR